MDTVSLAPWTSASSTRGTTRSTRERWSTAAAVRARAAPPAAIMPGMREVAIREDMIRLGQLLKLAGLVSSGAEAKEVLAEGAVTVNGEPEARRGRQLRRGDVVAAGDEEVVVA